MTVLVSLVSRAVISVTQISHFRIFLIAFVEIPDPDSHSATIPRLSCLDAQIVTIWTLYFPPLTYSYDGI